MGMDILYMQECTNREIIHIYYIYFLSVTVMCPIEPHSHHTLLASFGEDTAKTEEDIVNIHMWCEV